MRDLTFAGGLCFLALLALALGVLKLAGVTPWSWWWILAPLWVPVVTLLLAAFVIVCLSGRKE